MNIQTLIETKIVEHFNPEHLEVINESYMHNVPEGSESHFKVIMVSESFEGERLIKRHRAVNAILKEQLANDIHALALHTYTKDEWQKNFGEAPLSPNCMGGDRTQQG
ncbi:BolA family protein [Paraglaciecola marina]|uniref:BolA family protein n=1 Tax=Paraglaciecola marina TaxID=2500157 RepID=UPI00105D1DD5|nr:BolA/IbaG family iron-sulfur metabolism protein [Paraglaciecola marina]